MLLLSPCLPDEQGTNGHRRAWKLLQWAGHTHRVTLVATADEALHLSRWRQLSQSAERIELLPTASPILRLQHRLRRWLRQPDETPALRMDRHSSLARRYDAALCLSPQWWPEFRGVNAAVRMCDLRPADTVLARAIAQEAHVVLISPQQARALVRPAARVVRILDTSDTLAQRVAAHRLSLAATSTTMADSPSPPQHPPHVHVDWKLGPSPHRLAA